MAALLRRTLDAGDSIINFFQTKERLQFLTLDFSRLQGGALKVERKWQDAAGEIISEDFIAGVQPYENSFYMISLEDNDIVFGYISKQSGVVSLTQLEQSEPNDAGLLGVFQYTISLWPLGY